MKKSKNYYLLLCFLLIIAFSFIISCNIVKISNDRSLPLVEKALIKDLDVDGRIDAVDLVFTKAFYDNTFVFSDWKFSGKTATGLDTLGTANDFSMRILYATDDLSVDTSTEIIKIAYTGNTVKDQTGNMLEQFSDITKTDGACPVVTGASYIIDASGDGLGVNDLLEVTFSEGLYYASGVVATDIKLPVSGDSLGTGATFGINNGKLRIKLGASPNLKVTGAYNGTISGGSNSGVNINNAALTGRIEDYSGNNAKYRTQTAFNPNDAVDISSLALSGAIYSDTDHNGKIDATLDLVFSENIEDSSFVNNQWTFNSAAAINSITGSANDKYMKIVFPAGNPYIDTSLVSGTIAFLNGSSVQSSADNKLSALPNSDISIVKIDNARPVIVSASYSDVNTNGLVDANDALYLTFSEPIKTVSGVVAGDIVLPVTSDTLGTGPGPAFTLETGTAGRLKITLGTSPVLKITGSYLGTLTVPGSSSGINIAASPSGTIADLAGNNATTRTGTGNSPAEGVDIQ